MFFNLNYVQSFSYLQQYLIICSSISLISVWFGSVWCSIFLPVGSLFGFVLVKKGISLDKGLSISLFDFYNSFVEWREKQKREQSSAENDAVFAERLKAEREIFVEKICEKYFFWYKKFLSEDERFPTELKAIFRSIFERLEFRLKNIELSDATRRIFKLKTFHVEHCLKSFDLFNRQRKFQRTSENVEEEFSANFSFHWSISKNDPNSHIKAIVDFILTDLLPERFLLFSTPPARELITEILTNALFLPLVYRFSQPENVFFLIATIFENEQQRKIEESLDEDFPFSRTDFQQTSTQISDDPLDKNDEKFVSNNGNQQRIIFQAKITGNSNVSDEFSGANFTVYLIEVRFSFFFSSQNRFSFSARLNRPPQPMERLNTQSDDASENSSIFTNDWRKIRNTPKLWKVRCFLFLLRVKSHTTTTMLTTDVTNNETIIRKRTNLSRLTILSRVSSFFTLFSNEDRNRQTGRNKKERHAWHVLSDSVQFVTEDGVNSGAR